MVGTCEAATRQARRHAARSRKPVSGRPGRRSNRSGGGVARARGVRDGSLGSTGSIGTQALDVIRANPGRFEVVGLAAGTDRAGAEAQAAEFQVEHVALGVIEAEQLVRDVPADVVLNGITGSVGLGPTLAALESGRTLALANKESLIVGADLVAAGLPPPAPALQMMALAAVDLMVAAMSSTEESSMLCTTGLPPSSVMDADCSGLRMMLWTVCCCCARRRVMWRATLPLPPKIRVFVVAIVFVLFFFVCYVF